jgi:UPF0755 protein
MSKRSFRLALSVVIGSIVIVLALAGLLIQRACTYPDRAHDGSGAIVDVEVASGMSFPQVASMLADKGVISRPTWFRIYAMWRGDTSSVKSGKYHLADNLTPAVVLDTLVKGVKEITTRVTLPEGKHMLELFAILDAAHVATRAELEALARDKDFLAAHSITGDSVEGYLFPDTYEFRVPTKPRAVLERLIDAHRKVWNDALSRHPSADKVKDKLHWSDRDVLVLASIVEKEAVDPAERPRIAQVFVNRLAMPEFKPKRLETDPTIRYGCEVPPQKSAACQAWDRAGRLHSAQLRDKDNPYNTYEHEGLPPGPICNPGKGSIEAAMSPDGSEYLYFVAKDARNHAFARTYDEHKRNVEKYQK